MESSCKASHLRNTTVLNRVIFVFLRLIFGEIAGGALGLGRLATTEGVRRQPRATGKSQNNLKAILVIRIRKGRLFLGENQGERNYGRCALPCIGKKVLDILTKNSKALYQFSRNKVANAFDTLKNVRVEIF